ncbi:MAG: hypothetical protein FWF78_04210 [Defluviitaleaceae bacterium]|nr:hypothetical protein [Defluviitaleaceae bacterium]
MDVKRKSNIVGLIALFVILVVLGLALGYLYIALLDIMTSAWLAIIVSLGFGGLLAITVFFVRFCMVITNRLASFFVVLAGLSIVYYLKWSVFFALWFARFNDYDIGMFADFSVLMEWTGLIISYHFAYPVSEFIYDLTFFNYHGTWSWDGTMVTGVVLGVIWFVEFLIIFVPSLYVAVIEPGVYLESRGVFAEIKLMNYALSSFDENDLTKINEGFIAPIIEKPLATDRNQINAVALCYEKDQLTEYIAIFRATLDDKTGELSTGKRLTTVALSVEKVEELKAEMEKKHSTETA